METSVSAATGGKALADVAQSISEALFHRILIRRSSSQGERK